MKMKISKLIFMFIAPIVACLSLGIFLASSFVSNYAFALTQYGGCFSVLNNSTMKIETGSSISGFKAEDGGGVYVAYGGTLSLNGGTISQNSALGYGGGAYINSGCFNIYSGSIAENNGCMGGGIYANNAEIFMGEEGNSSNTTGTSVGGEIKNNTGSSGGGGYFENIIFTMNNGTISGNTADYDGGGVYFSNSEFTMNGGTIFGNTATSGNGHNVYNTSTFTMNGGTIGTSGSSQTGYGIYNTGIMKLYGGMVYDDIYSSASFTTKMGANLNGTISLGDSATITVQDYAGVTPEYKINLSSSRGEGTILTFSGSSTQPSLTKIAVSGYDTETYNLKVVQGSSSTEWNVVLEEIAVERVFPSTWNSEVASTTYMTTTVTPSSLTSIRFEKTVPSGYVQIGKLSTGLKVYQNSTTSTAIAFVNAKSIFAPERSNYLFSGFSSLTSLSFNNFDTSNVTNMLYMFYGCSGLTSLNLSGFDTSNVKVMNGMFYNCSKLTSLDVSSFDTSNVDGMNCMFYNCSKLTSLDVENFNTSKVDNMGSMFYSCSSLTSLDVGGFDTSSVTSMNAMFYSCSKLTSLNVDNFDTSKVEDMGVMFYNCSKLTSLDLGGFDTSSVTNMNAMFNSCSSLTSLDIENFNTAQVENMADMFYYCLSLASLDLSSFDTSNVTDMGWMFHTCSSLTSLDLGNFDTSKVTDMEGMFKNSQNLKNVELSSFNTSNVTTMRIMFDNCPSIETLDLSSFNMAKVTSSSYMLTFGSSAVLKQLKTPYNNTSALSITTGNTLYDISTGSSVSSVPANTTSSKTFAVRYAVTFNASGGTCSTESKYVYYGCSYGSLPTPTKTGYTFDGWSKNYFDISKINSIDDTCTISGNKITCAPTSSLNVSYTFRIQYVKDHSYVGDLVENVQGTGSRSYVFTKNSTFNQMRIKLNSSDEDSGFTFDLSNLVDGHSYVISVNIDELKLNKLVVSNIMIEENGENISTSYSSGNVSSSSYIVINSDHTLFAKWTVMTYNISFNTSGGNSMSSKTYSKSSLSQSVSFAVPTKSGYILSYWQFSWTDTNHSSTVPTISNSSVTIPADCFGNMTLTAVWIQASSGGGSEEGNTPGEGPNNFAIGFSDGVWMEDLGERIMSTSVVSSVSDIVSFAIITPTTGAYIDYTIDEQYEIYNDIYIAKTISPLNGCDTIAILCYGTIGFGSGASYKNTTFLMQFENLEYLDFTGFGTSQPCSFRLPDMVEEVYTVSENNVGYVKNSGATGFSVYCCPYSFSEPIAYSDSQAGSEFFIPGNNNTVYAEEINSIDWSEYFDDSELGFVFASMLSPEIYENYAIEKLFEISEDLYFARFDASAISNLRAPNYSATVADLSYGIITNYGLLSLNVSDFTSSMPAGGFSVTDFRGLYEVSDQSYIDVSAFGSFALGAQFVTLSGSTEQGYSLIAQVPVKIENDQVSTSFETNQEIQAILEDEKKRYFSSKKEIVDDSDNGENEN